MAALHMTSPLPWTDAIEERVLELVECMAEDADHGEGLEALAELLHAVLEVHGAPVKPRFVIGQVNQHLDEPLYVPENMLSAAVNRLCKAGRAQRGMGRLHPAVSSAVSPPPRSGARVM